MQILSSESACIRMVGLEVHRVFDGSRRVIVNYLCACVLYRVKCVTFCEVVLAGVRSTGEVTLNRWSCFIFWSEARSRRHAFQRDSLISARSRLYEGTYVSFFLFFSSRARVFIVFFYMKEKSSSHTRCSVNNSTRSRWRCTSPKQKSLSLANFYTEKVHTWRRWARRNAAH
jgi:hypothetical protein